MNFYAPWNKTVKVSNPNKRYECKYGSECANWGCPVHFGGSESVEKYNKDSKMTDLRNKNSKPNTSKSRELQREDQRPLVPLPSLDQLNKHKELIDVIQSQKGKKSSNDVFIFGNKIDKIDTNIENQRIERQIINNPPKIDINIEFFKLGNQNLLDQYKDLLVTLNGQNTSKSPMQ